MKTSFFIMLITVALTAATASAQFVPRGGGYGPRDGERIRHVGPARRHGLRREGGHARQRHLRSDGAKGAASRQRSGPRPPVRKRR